jgi:hypothetical protein
MGHLQRISCAIKAVQVMCHQSSTSHVPSRQHKSCLRGSSSPPSPPVGWLSIHPSRIQHQAPTKTLPGSTTYPSARQQATLAIGFRFHCQKNFPTALHKGRHSSMHDCKTGGVEHPGWLRVWRVCGVEGRGRGCWDNVNGGLAVQAGGKGTWDQVGVGFPTKGGIRFGKGKTQMCEG